MEQKSNVQYRAEKEYKYSHEKFFLLLREIISNAIHAVIIRKSKEPDLIPQLDLTITFDDSHCKIELKDNGDGFTEKNRQCFEQLDWKNLEKEQHNFHPLGQGRLAIVFFADSSEYETVYKDDNGIYQKRTFQYPHPDVELFDFSQFQPEEQNNKSTYTKLTVLIDKQQTVKRAQTFFKDHDNIQSFKDWFVGTFFPFIITTEELTINISLNGEDCTIKKDTIESEAITKPFNVQFVDSNPEFILWLIKKGTPMRGDNSITCFARNLKAELSNGKLIYSIDNEDGYLLYLTSEYFDRCVDNKGEKIEISADDICKINEQIIQVLDTEFQGVITRNREKTKRNLKQFQTKYPSLEAFVDYSSLTAEKKIVDEAAIINQAIQEKSKAEKRFWNNADKGLDYEDSESITEKEDRQKLLNSSLQIYVKHRERVLKQLHDMIQKFDEEGEQKTEAESKVHELFINRGTTLSNSSNINHLHNLWILDNKFTTFSSNFQVKSTKQGQEASDIYVWGDDPEKTKQILIFELKSTTKAHNAGAMIAQVKRYAQDVYIKPERILNWDVETAQVQYTGIILARKSDINKELTSNSSGGGYKPIPFLKNSYYFDDNFSIDDNPRHKMDIRIELYSFEDIYELASSRNEVFFRLLRKEFEFNPIEDATDDSPLEEEN